MPPTNHPDSSADAAPESLLGQPVLDAWVPTAVAAKGSATDVLRAEPVDGESKVLVHVVRLPPGTAVDELEADLEARRRVRHPGVLPLLMAGAMPDGRFVVVTPSRGSSTLASQLAMRPPRLPEALRMASQVARALKAFHDSVGVYGPLTPEHVFVTPDASGHDQVSILPVWWAWRHGRDLTHAAPWQPLMRIDEKRRMADDAYALGALVWHAVAGLPPRDEDALDTLTGGPPAPVPALSTMVRRSLPPGLEPVVSALLSLDRADRPSDLSAVADRLDDMVHQLEGGGGPVIAPPMIMATPVPVGGQLRERSLVLPVAPPAATEDPPTAPSGTRKLRGLHTPAPRRRDTASPTPPPRKPAPAPAPAPLGVMPAPRTGPRYEDAPTVIEDDDDPLINQTTAVEPVPSAPQQTQPMPDPAPAAAPSRDAAPEPPTGASPSPATLALLGISVVALGAIAVIASLYLVGFLG